MLFWLSPKEKPLHARSFRVGPFWMILSNATITIVWEYCNHPSICGSDIQVFIFFVLCFSQISRASLVPESSYIAKPAASWLDDFLVWISPEAFGCCRKFTNGSYCPPDDQVKNSSINSINCLKLVSVSNFFMQLKKKKKTLHK